MTLSPHYAAELIAWKHDVMAGYINRTAKFPELNCSMLSETSECGKVNGCVCEDGVRFQNCKCVNDGDYDPNTNSNRNPVSPVPCVGEDLRAGLRLDEGTRDVADTVSTKELHEKGEAARKRRAARRAERRAARKRSRTEKKKTKKKATALLAEHMQYVSAVLTNQSITAATTVIVLCVVVVGAARRFRDRSTPTMKKPAVIQSYGAVDVSV